MKTLRFVLFFSVLGLRVAAQTAVLTLDFENAGDLTVRGGTYSPTFFTNNYVTSTAGVNGGLGAYFDGFSHLSAYDSTASGMANPLTTAMTLTFWMNTTTPGSSDFDQQWYLGSGLIDGELGGLNADWGISLFGHNLAFGVGRPSQYSDFTILSTSTVTTGDWVFVAATWDTSGNMELYINGVLDVSSSQGSTEARATNIDFQIGRDPYTGRYTGSLDNIRIYDTVLTSGQIATLAIPEPSTYAALAGLAALGLAAARRRRSAA